MTASNFRAQAIEGLQEQLEAIHTELGPFGALAEKHERLTRWRVWSARVVAFTCGAEEAVRFEVALLPPIDSDSSAAAWMDRAQRCLRRLAAGPRQAGAGA